MTESQPSAAHKSEQPDKLLGSLEKVQEDQKDKQIQDLQNELAKEKDARDEERFFYIICLVILFNIAIFSGISNWAVPIVVGIFELIFIFFLAKRLGMEEVATLFSRLIARITDGVAKQ